MMSDTSIDHIIESCKSYLLVPGNNFMIDSFTERLNALPDLTDDAQKEFCARNEAALEEHFVPAYKLLIEGLEKLKGTRNQRKRHVRISGWKSLLRISCIHSNRNLLPLYR